MSSAKVFQFGPPKILEDTEKLQSGKLGQDVSLTCDSFAIPKPEKGIVWNFKGNAIVDNEHYQITKSTKVDGVLSTLLIKKAVATDFGDYECKIDNGFGADAFIVKLFRIGIIEQIQTYKFTYQILR